MAKKKKITVSYTMNERGIKIRKCCASCAYKCITSVGKRICSLTDEKVDARFLCPEWDLNEVLQNAGRFRGGVVRDIDTKEVILR